MFFLADSFPIFFSPFLLSFFSPFLFSLSSSLYPLSIHWKSFGLSPSKNLEIEHWSTRWLGLFYYQLKEARNSFFGLGVYLLKSKFRIEGKLRFPWFYTTFSTYNQNLFPHWFPSTSCHHSNGNGQPLILNNVEYLEN